MSTGSEQEIEAGWYQDDTRERYWDGVQWTDRYRPLSTEGGPQAVDHVAGEGEGIEYKVLTQKDRFFGGKFDPEKLEAGINSYATQGWRVVGIATADVPGFGTSRQELVVVMSRER
jgi:Domain of unknown function (DUF4177)/Protein of unknown function (DUF2510)